MDATSFLVLAGSVNRLVEVLKPSIKNATTKFQWSDDAYAASVQFVAIVLGILIAFVAGGVNLLPAVLPVSATVGTIVTGIVIGLGSDAVNLVIDFLYSYQRPTVPPTSTPTTPPAA
jgi:hypothetical protein